MVTYTKADIRRRIRVAATEAYELALARPSLARLHHANGLVCAAALANAENPAVLARWQRVSEYISDQIGERGTGTMKTNHTYVEEVTAYASELEACVVYQTGKVSPAVLARTARLARLAREWANAATKPTINS